MTKKFKRIVNFLLCITLVLSMMSVPAVTGLADTAASTEVLLLNTAYAKLKVDEAQTLTLKAVLKGSAYSVADVTWSSTEEGVATVADGVVTPISEGTTLITAETESGVTAKCTVDVYDSRLYFEERWISVKPDSNSSTTETTLTATYALAGSLANEAEVTNTYDAATNAVSTDFATLDSENSTVTFTRTDSTKNGSGIAEIVATADDNGEEVTAKCYISAWGRGADANASVHMAAQKISGGVQSEANELLWKFGYKDGENFVAYNTATATKIYTSGKGQILSNTYAWQPNSSCPSVMIWKAPKTGTVSVSRGATYNSYMYAGTGYTSSTQTYDSPFSVKLDINYEGVNKFSKTYEAEETESGSGIYKYRTTIYTADDIKDEIDSINVKKGDEIEFVLSLQEGTPYVAFNASMFKVAYTSVADDNATEVNISSDNISLISGDTYKLTGTDIETYVSSNDNVAMVSTDGTVTATGEGDAIIYAVNSDATLADYCTVKVTGKKILLNKSYAKLEINDKLKLNAVWSDLSKKASVVWSSSDEDIATVDSNGVVKPVCAGTTLITATATDGTVVKCTVDVYDERLYFEENWISIAPTLNVKADNVATGSYVLKGTLKDTAVVAEGRGSKPFSTGTTTNADDLLSEVSNGNITANASGITELIATVQDGDETVTAKCYLSIGLTGMDANPSVHMNVQDIVEGSPVWQYGYMDDINGFTEYAFVNAGNLGICSSDSRMYNDGYIFLNGQKWAPGKDNDSVMVWTAPKNGTVDIGRGTAYTHRIYQGEIAGSETTEEKYAINMQIIFEDDVKFSQTYESVKNEGTEVYPYRSTIDTSAIDSTEALKNITVKKGDRIYFVAHTTEGSDTPYLQLNSSYFRVKYTSTQQETETDFGIAEDDITLAGGATCSITTTDCAQLVSSNEAVATVDANGNITAKGKGTAVIYAINSDGTLADACDVTVSDWGKPVLTGSTLTVSTTESGKTATVVVAVKKGNVLKSAYFATLNESTFTVNDISSEEGDSIVVYVWEDMDTLKPLKAAITLE